jgi:hypothetical protein
MTDGPNSKITQRWQGFTQLWQGFTRRMNPAGPIVPDLPPPNSKPFAIKEVLARELQQVRSLAAARNVRDRLNPIPGPGKQVKPDTIAPEQFGACFSGGGIRSASVNLGLIQSLAKSGFLRQVHYLSGVSGGGYILGWLTGWIARVGFDSVEAQLQSDSAWPKNDLPERPGFRRFLEPNPIHYLRRYVSYLVPCAGLSSGDTLAAAAIYLRNVLLVQAPVWAALTAIFAVFQMLAPHLLWPKLVPPSMHGWVWWAASALLVLTLAICVWVPLDLLARNVKSRTRRKWATFARVIGTAGCVLAWLKIPAYLNAHAGQKHWLLWPAAAVFVFFMSEEIVGGVAFLLKDGPEGLKSVEPDFAFPSSMLAAAGASGLTALLLYGFSKWLHSGSYIVVSDWYVILGLPALLAAASLLSFLYIGLFGDSFPDAKREWLGRLAGYYLYFAGVIAIVLFLALRGPLCMEWLFSPQHANWKNQILKWLLPGGWIATTIGGLFAARSPATGEGGLSPAKEAMAAIAPPVFLLGLMLVASWGTHMFAARFGATEYLTSGVTVVEKQPAVCPVCSNTPPPKPHFVVYGATWRLGDSVRDYPPLGSLALGSALISLFLGWRVTVNEFSLHLFYRNRLVRTFLGASNMDARRGIAKRRPDPFTGFSLDDDLYLGSLRQGKYDGPYPMWCAALNLTAGEDLAWQKRKAASFLFSPMFCGWDYMPTSLSRVKGNAYREVAACTDDGRSNGVGYGGPGGAPLIGTAMAASGAAISPNWGFHTKPAIAALLALFNIRIGWWTGNPLDPKGYLKYTPGVSYFLSELLGMANEENEYVYLSDGGHFENLGLYELIRRRVKFIIASDADADPTYEFGDMANAIEKCKVDFGVQIEMGEYMTISPVPATRLSTTHFSVGLIHYLPQTAEEVVEGTSPGVLLYIKSSLTGDEPAQVLGQHVPGSAFPHDTTLNQFFNETQFETYRALGEHMGSVLFERYAAYQKEKRAPWPDNNPMTREERAAYVRTFFESFLKAARKDQALLQSH